MSMLRTRLRVGVDVGVRNLGLGLMIKLSKVRVLSSSCYTISFQSLYPVSIVANAG